MAKELYIPVNGFSKKTSKFYAPVNGFSKEIVKAYCSVNGFSKLFYVKGGGASEWYKYEVLDKKCIDITSYGTTYSYSKVNVGIAYYAAFKMGSVVSPLFISTDADAVTIHTTVGDRTTTYNGNITYNGDTWYYNTHWGVPVDETLPIESLVTPSDCLLPNEYSSVQDAVEYFLANYIYSNDFADNYQELQQYSLVYADKQKTVRRAIGVFLYKNAQVSEAINSICYSSLLSVIDTIANDIASQPYDLALVMINFEGSTSGIKNVELVCHFSNSSLSNITPYNRLVAEGYTHFNLIENFQYIKTKRYWILEREGILRTAESTSYSFAGAIGINSYYRAPTQSNNNVYYHVDCSNIGLDL